MSRTRLRPAHSPAELARIYAAPHRHDRWPDHVLRVQTTIALARWVHKPGTSVADLSCGDAAIATALNEPATFLGDFAPTYLFTGPIEQTVHELRARIYPLRVGTFILSETIEHLDDPDSVLALLRGTADRLVLSTPIDEDLDSENVEHYWSWGTDDMRAMLTAAGWEPFVLNELRLTDTEYDYQIWGCR